MISEMQSEGGVAGAIHGALQAGALATTFTASQGLLLMLPNMYKIAGELTAFVMHVTGRTVATHAATLETRVPFMHFFDGFRTSHEVSKLEELADDDLRRMIDEALIRTHRERALTPDRPVVRGTAYNPDAHFQGREAANLYYLECPEFVQGAMDRFAEITGRRYRLFEYVGHPEAERVIVIMGSGAETVHETVDWMLERDKKVGLVKVRLYRPFSVKDFAAALPASVRNIAVLDRTKEPGSIGEP